MYRKDLVVIAFALFGVAVVVELGGWLGVREAREPAEVLARVDGSKLVVSTVETRRDLTCTADAGTWARNERGSVVWAVTRYTPILGLELPPRAEQMRR